MTGSASKLETTAERMAKELFEERVAELAALAGDDLDAVHEAIKAVQSKATAAGTPEHIAFTLLAATWRRVADRRKIPPKRTRESRPA